MRRKIKEVISGIVLVISIVGIYLFTQQMIFSTSNTGYYGIAILVMVALCLISMLALVTFSSSGWSLEGSCGEWVAAAENYHQLCISLGCKGSRKHSRYGDDEVIVGIPKKLVIPIQEGLEAIPGVFD